MLLGRVPGALALASAVLLLGAGCSVFGDDDDGEYGADLVKYGDKGEPNRYVNLDDGEAQLAIGSPDGHRIVVQWRDPDGSGWTEPETVWEDKDDRAIENTVRYGGGTVAIRQVYTTDIHSDSDIDSFTIGIVCRDLSCDADKSPGFGGEGQVTPDGRYAYLGQSEKGASLWTEDEGIHLARWSGHPGFDYHKVSPSEPVLAPDGSLRLVSSVPSRDSCTFELLTSKPDSAKLQSVARSTQPLRGRFRSDCRSYNNTYSSDWVGVQPDDHRAREFWFERNGDEWVVTYEDPSGLRIVDVDRGCCDSYLAGFIHWNSVAYGSPGGRSIVVQTHLLGDETWSEPVVLDGARPGDTCTWMDGYEVGDHGFAVLMVCHSGKVRDEYVGDVYAVAVTPDLGDWESMLVTDVKQPPEVEGDLLTVGDTTWSPDEGFESR